MRISAHALEDIMVMPPAVQAVHREVMRLQLRPWPRSHDPYEGAISDHISTQIGEPPNEGLRWRRGGTDAIRLRLDAGGAVDAAILTACDFVIIFEVKPVPRQTDPNWRHLCRFRIIRIWHNDQLAPAVVAYLAKAAQAARGSSF